MENIIKHVQVEGLWGVKSFDTNFNNDINIIIGQNGSNKTTFLSLIEAGLMCELRTLQQIPFRRIVYDLSSNNGDTECIEVERILEEEWFIIKYSFPGEEPVAIRLFEDYEERYYRGNSMMRESLFHIRELLDRRINMSWLSVDRYTENIEDSRRPYRNVVDKKLNDLLHELAVYRLRLLEQTNKLTSELNAQVISLLLYDNDTDNFDFGKLDRFSSLEPKEIKTSLYRVFKQMGNMEQMSDKIQLHISKLTDAINRVKTGDKLTLNDAASLVLIGKTLSIIDLSKKYKESVDSILEPITTYIKTLKRFISDKDFNFSEDKGLLEISWIYKGPNNDHITPLKPQNLSSGEKQLLILLTQTLLQEKNPYIFIADEPELSLHIQWQKNIIGAIHGINQNAQIIVATHSPEIAGQWMKKIITMESITHYED